MADVAVDGFAAGGNSGIADTTIFFERAFGLDGFHTEFGAILFEDEFISGANAHGTPNGVRDRDLALACDAACFFSVDFGIPYLSITFLTIATFNAEAAFL